MPEPCFATAPAVLARRPRALCPRRAVVRCTRSVRVRASASAVQCDAEAFIEQVKFDAAGLVVAVAQQWDSGEVLMVAWMDAEAIRATMREGRAVYYSRSRKRLWRKGEQSGNVQTLQQVLLDCDGDTIVLKVDQIGQACHTGRRTCFYRELDHDGWHNIMEPLRDPAELYGEK